MPKLLVIEDEKTVRENIVELFSSQNYKVLSAADGEAGLKLLENENPDLVISDIMMPKVNGYEVLEQFRKRNSFANTPFIFLTAKSEMKDFRTGMSNGADDYITKPYKAKDLLRAVETRIEKKKNIDEKFEAVYNNIALYVPHELRTPLISIIGFSDIMIEEIDDLSMPEIIEMIKNINYSGKRLHKTIEKFLLYSEIELQLKQKNNKLPKAEVTSAAAIIKEVIKNKNENEQSRIKENLTDSILKISSAHFKFIIEELLTNAAKFSADNSEIKIESAVDKNKFELRVTDKGCGMTQQQIESIAPFNQHGRDVYQQSGNGLGLIIIKKICELYNGQLKIESKLNSFTGITLTLPIT